MPSSDPASAADSASASAPASAAVDTHAAVDAHADAVAASAAWHESRDAFVRSPLGNLALVSTVWSQAGDALVPDEEALRDYPEHAVLTRLRRANIDTGETENGYRVWLTDSPANLAFERIESYEYDPSWVIEASFEFVDDGRVVPFEHIRDNGSSRGLPVSGDLVFTRDGVDYRLSAFDTAEKLQLVFGDPTNGTETYGAGRFLYVERPELGDDPAPGTRYPVVLDFNRAFVPPCGFSTGMNCPLPPAQNRFRVPVRAGEKRVVYADGFELV